MVVQRFTLDQIAIGQRVCGAQRLFGNLIDAPGFKLRHNLARGDDPSAVVTSLFGGFGDGQEQTGGMRIRISRTQLQLGGTVKGNALQSLCAGPALGGRGDRKSTRLNSSHMSISYAVFCLKKKKKKKT